MTTEGFLRGICGWRTDSALASLLRHAGVAAARE